MTDGVRGSDVALVLDTTLDQLRRTLYVVMQSRGVLCEDVAELRAHLETCCNDLSALRAQIPRIERTHAIELRVGRDTNAKLLAENRTLREGGDAAAGKS